MQSEPSQHNTAHPDWTFGKAEGCTSHWLIHQMICGSKSNRFNAWWITLTLSCLLKGITKFKRCAGLLQTCWLLTLYQWIYILACKPIDNSMQFEHSTDESYIAARNKQLWHYYISMAVSYAGIWHSLSIFYNIIPDLYEWKLIAFRVIIALWLLRSFWVRVSYW